MDDSLLAEFIGALSLPEEISIDFVARLLVQHNIDPQSITIEDLRLIAASVLLEAIADQNDETNLSLSWGGSFSGAFSALNGDDDLGIETFAKA